MDRTSRINRRHAGFSSRLPGIEYHWASLGRNAVSSGTVEATLAGSTRPRSGRGVVIHRAAAHEHANYNEGETS